MRPFVQYKDPVIDPLTVSAHPGAYANLTDCFKTVLIDNPNETVTINDDRTGWKAETFALDKLLAKIESAKGAAAMPKLGDEDRALFRKEMESLAGADARIKACRAELADPERKNTFRKIAAMESLVGMLGAKAMPDLVPYLGQGYWRLRDRSRDLAVGLLKAGGGEELAGALRKSAEPATKAGIFAVLAAGKDKSGIAPARSGLKDGSPVVRVAAMKALLTLGGESVLPEALAHFAAAREPEELAGCEDALLIAAQEPKYTPAVREGLIKMLPGADPAVKASAWYVLARIGDAKCIAALKTAAGTNNMSELGAVVMALSYSPSREADRILLDIAATGKKGAELVGAQSVRRMVLGPKGYGDITNAQRMDFAEQMVKLAMDGKLVTYLGGVSDARALRALMDCLKRGYTKAAESLVNNSENLEKLNAADNLVAVDAIRNVIEYIEVTHLRGGVKAHMDKDSNYTYWKALQARAGKSMLKLHQPEKAPINGFDPLEIER